MPNSQVPLFDESELPVPADAEARQIAEQVARNAGYGEDADFNPDTGKLYN